MAIDLTGISNENEFNTHHYLSVILENDLNGLFKKWKEEEDENGVKQPNAILTGYSRDYFKVKNAIEKTKESAELVLLQRKILANLFSTLKYPVSNTIIELESGNSIPLFGEIQKKNGAPELWLIEAVTTVDDSLDPLNAHFLGSQYMRNYDDFNIPETYISELISKEIFSLNEPPRWIILFNFNNIVLIDRSKWNENRFLKFDLDEIFSRREPSTFKAMAALLHRESIVPEDGMCLLDTLDENSHKHAFSVSEDLKYSVREAVEILGNEAVDYLKNVKKTGVFDKQLAEKLTIECLRYLYRLLFILYIEARPELKYAPMDSEEYLTGYSLESLRDLEIVQLTTDEAKSGYFINTSLQILFGLIFKGLLHEQLEAGSQFHTFEIMPLKSHLFDPGKTPILSSVKFRNSALQKVLELLSLSRAKKGKHRRGRISYAQLGINQFGAVYEGLLSYSGFFVETDLYEVKKAGDSYDELKAAYFVKAEDLPEYTEDEKVYNVDGTLKMHKKGMFIYRLSGRSRQKSASYNTPEVLTQCLVKYALKELLKDKSADDILELTFCEPALGSGAFLNEAINQLAEAYLDRKQKEPGFRIAHDEYLEEKQKV